VTTAPAAIPPGHYNGWCVEERVDIGVYGGATLTPYNGQVFSSCDPNLNAYLINEPAATNGNWQAVNYILNNRAGYSYSDVQASIWYFVGSGTPPSPTPYYGDGDGSPYVFHPTQANVDALVGAALSNMAAWVAAGHPWCGEKSAAVLLFDGNPNPAGLTDVQLLLIEVPCMCLTCPSSCGHVSDPYSSALVTGTAPYTYSFISGSLPTGLTPGATDGTITGIPSAAGTFPFTVQVVDSSTPPQTNTVACSITIYSALAVTCAASIAQVGVPYSSAFVASGGSGSYMYKVSGLPDGLTVNPTTGALTGTPTTTGTFPYTVIITDNAGCGTASQSCSITVNPPPSANCVTISAVQNVAITPVTLTPSGGCGGPYTFTATGLPNGLTMSNGGTISGTPTVSVISSYTTVVKDGCGNKGTNTCSVTVNPPPSANCVTINAVQNVAITPVTLTASGGCGGPYTFTAMGLPNGLTMSTGGTISGTPTVSVISSYTTVVKDGCGNKGTNTCSVTVNPTPSANCVTISAVQNVAITPITLTPSGGCGGPYTFTGTGLANGLTMSNG